MEEIELQAEACWIPEPDDPDSCNLDEEKFRALVIKTYDYISEPEDSIFSSDDGDARICTYMILATEAVRRNDMPFFLKINMKEESLAFHGEEVIQEIWDTQRFEFYEAMNNNIKSLHNWLNKKHIDAVVKCAMKYYTPDEIMKQFRRVCNFYTANALINCGIPFQMVLDKCEDRLKPALLQDQV